MRVGDAVSALDPVVVVNDSMLPVGFIPRNGVTIVVAEDDGCRIRLPVGCIKVICPGGATGWAPAAVFALLHACDPEGAQE